MGRLAGEEPGWLWVPLRGSGRAGWRVGNPPPSTSEPVGPLKSPEVGGFGLILGSSGSSAVMGGPVGSGSKTVLVPRLPLPLRRGGLTGRRGGRRRTLNIRVRSGDASSKTYGPMLTERAGATAFFVTVRNGGHTVRKRWE